MTESMVLDLARSSLLVTLKLAGPLLVAALATGLIVSVVQAVTSIQEQTLSFVPKLFAVGLTFLLLLPWMLQQLLAFALEVFRAIPTLTG